jgi:hypothetical protein
VRARAVRKAGAGIDPLDADNFGPGIDPAISLSEQVPEI